MIVLSMKKIIVSNNDILLSINKILLLEIKKIESLSSLVSFKIKKRK